MLTRTELSGAVDDRLYFAQVREDPRLELDALKAHLNGPVVVVSSGGCTALSLIAEGAQEVVGVDLNRTQNHLVELKAAAIRRLRPGQALRMLGGAAENPAVRLREYETLREDLSLGARRYWDGKPKAIAAGVLGVGVTEVFLRSVARGLQLTVHSKKRINRFLATQSLAAQREFFDREWNSARWRRLFDLLGNRLVLRRTYDPAFFAHVGEMSFPAHFRHVAERTLTELPLQDNYFLHYMATGSYPVDVPGGLPPYLDGAALDGNSLDGNLALVDGAFGDYLRTCPDDSITGFSLSNICEWLTVEQIDDLFGEIVRTAAPGARLCFRNFVGWTEVPERWREQVREDKALGEELMRSDRSMMQRRFAVCDIRKGDAS